jgi:hypothetical protein
MVLYVPPSLHNVKEEDKKLSVQLKNHVNKYLQQSNGKLFYGHVINEYVDK